MRQLRKSEPWLLGILIASLLFAALLVFSSFQYIGSDDTPILHAFMGYDGGEVATFHLYLHTAFAWLLWLLAKLSPGAAWFSVLQLFLLWFSQVVLVKSFAQLARRRGWPGWAGALTGAAFLAAYALYITCRISYTTTSALCGAAAVAQLMSVDFTAEKRRSVIGPILGSVALLLCAYCLRQISVLPPLCFWLLALGVKLLSAFGKGKRPWRAARPVMLSALLTALIFGLMVGVRAIDIRIHQAEDFFAWQNERIQLFDYTDFDKTTTAETLRDVGWSDNEFTLVTYWYFMDDNISTEALHTLNAQQRSDDAFLTVGTRLSAARQTFLNCLSINPAVRTGLWAALAMALAAVLAAIIRRDHNPWTYLGILGATLGGGLLLGYLAWTGRLPMRAAMSVLLPAAGYLYAAFFGIAPPPAQAAAASGAMPINPDGATDGSATVTPPAPAAALPPRAAFSAFCKAFLILTLLACLWMTVATVQTVAPSIRPHTDEEDNYATVNLTDLDAYALENPDTLFIYDLSLVSDCRLFPDTSAGVPDNVMFWGGYPARSPSWYRMLAKFGITEMNASIFLRDNVLIASTDPEPWTCLMGYISEYAGENVDWDYYDTVGYVNFFQVATY